MRLIRSFVFNWFLPITLVVGWFSPWASVAYPLARWLLGAMIFVALCAPSAVAASGDKRRLFVVLLLNAIAGPLLAILVGGWNGSLALALLLVGMAPTATAGPAVTGLLGGRAGFTMASVFITHLGAALWIPFLLAFFTTRLGEAPGGMPLTSWEILRGVAPLLLIPWALAFVVRHWLPTVQSRIRPARSVVMPFWAITVFLVGARTRQMWDGLENPASLSWVLGVAALTLLACLAQFRLGHLIGGKSKQAQVEVAQSLGQKNTILMMWVALNWAGPVAALGPLSYIMWQNILLGRALVKADS